MLSQEPKQISNKDFCNAYYGDPSDPESMEQARKNRGIIKKVTGFFQSQLPPDILESCGYEALLNCLKKHNGDGRKFTSSLFLFTKWACLNELNDGIYSRHKPSFVTIERPGSIINKEENETNVFMRECVRLLPKKYRELIEKRFYDGMTLEEIGAVERQTRQSAHKKVTRALSILKQIYLERN